MSRYTQRLTRLQQSFGVLCATHEEALTCPSCEPSADYPAVVASGMDDFIKALINRVGHEALKAMAFRVTPPPPHEPCPCGTRRQCWLCQVRYSEALLQAIGLSHDEQIMLADLQAMCRRIDRKRRAYDEP